MTGQFKRLVIVKLCCGEYNEDSTEGIVEQAGQYYNCYELGHIKAGSEKIVTKNKVRW